MTIVLMLGVCGCIFPADQPGLLWWSMQAHWIALVYMLLGLCFLAINNKRLMMVCMGCSAAICFYELEVLHREIDFMLRAIPAFTHLSQ